VKGTKIRKTDATRLALPFKRAGHESGKKIKALKNNNGLEKKKKKKKIGLKDVARRSWREEKELNPCPTQSHPLYILEGTAGKEKKSKGANR